MCTVPNLCEIGGGGLGGGGGGGEGGGEGKGPKKGKYVSPAMTTQL